MAKTESTKEDLSDLSEVRTFGISFFFWKMTILFFLICCIFSYIDNQKPETQYSQEFKSGDKVYVDIVSLDPKFFTSKFSHQTGRGPVYAMVCLCETTDASECWICLSYDNHDYDSDYKRLFCKATGNYPPLVWRPTPPKAYDYEKITFPSPIRIHGWLTKADSAFSNKPYYVDLSNEMIPDLIISYDSFDKE